MLEVPSEEVVIAVAERAILIRKVKCPVGRMYNRSITGKSNERR